MTGGEIKGNTAKAQTSYGGGVSYDIDNWVPTAAFIKSGGTIFGNNGGADSNLAVNLSNGQQSLQGHAVYVCDWNTIPETVRRRESTSTGTLNSSINGGAGGWE